MGGEMEITMPDRSICDILTEEYAIELKKHPGCGRGDENWSTWDPASIDLLYNLEHIINPSRLTKTLAQFG